MAYRVVCADVERGVVRACLFALAGMLALQLTSFPLSSDLQLALLVAIGLLLPWLERRDFAFLLLGGGLFLTAAARELDERIEPRFVGDSMLAEVRIAEFPSRRGDTVSFVAEVADDARIPRRIRLSWFEPPVEPRLGDTWRLELRLRRPRGTLNPGVFDYEAWLFRERIAAAGYVAGGVHTLLLDSGRLGRIDRLRAAFVRRADRVLDDPQAVSVLVAIAVGARHRMAPEQWERYARTGTSHLMAISGLHVGLAAAGAFLLASALFGALGGRGNHYRGALAAALVVAVGYALVSGFAVPARRAVLMLAFGTAALMAYRPPAAARLLALAALAIAMTDPLATMTPGFKLSFAAVALLIWLAGRVSPRRSALAALREFGLAQLVLLMGLLPLVALSFARVSLAAPLINALAVPLFSFATVPLALAGLLLDGPAAGLGDLALRAAAATIGWLEALIAAAARHDAAAFAVADPAGIAWLYLLLPLAWVVLPSGWPARRVAWLALPALMLWRPAPPPEGCADVVTLDVGQGLAVFVRTRDRTLLYDTGPAYRDGGSAAERIILPYLAGRGVRRLDRIVISHADLDHAGGLHVLARFMSPDEVLSPEPLPWSGRPLRPCVAGVQWSWNEVRFSVLHPAIAGAGKRNDSSCVLLVEAGERRALLAGDIEAAAEAALVRARILPPVDVTTVPHHGSRTSSTAPFIRSLDADYAVVSAAHGNRWGFPKPDVVARWQSHGATVLTTAGSGAISMRLCAGARGVDVSEWRRQAQRLWHESD